MTCTNRLAAASAVTRRPRLFRPVPCGPASGGGKVEGNPGRCLTSVPQPWERCWVRVGEAFPPLLGLVAARAVCLRHTSRKDRPRSRRAVTEHPHRLGSHAVQPHDLGLPDLGEVLKAGVAGTKQRPSRSGGQLRQVGRFGSFRLLPSDDTRAQQRVVVGRALVEAGQHRPGLRGHVGALVVLAGEPADLARVSRTAG
jgi:hypothetical protein